MELLPRKWVRWWLPLLGLSCATLSQAAETAGSSALVLTPRPVHIFKTTDRSHENTESWTFSVIVEIATPEKLTPASMKVSLLRDASLLSTTSYFADGLKDLIYKPNTSAKLADGSNPPVPAFWPFAIRLRDREPVSLGVNSLRVELDAVNEAGRHRQGMVVLPLETFRQKVALIFPFRGKGIILQAGATNGGHRNRSGLFALDACGLDDAWSITAPGDAKQSSDYRGWGRELIAPADGIVVRSRNDRPDQPVADESDPKFYAPEYPTGGDPGNHVVIHHGGSEFSMIAHFQSHSLLVKAGDHVRQGQVLGKLGQSGDANGPHCHYQLQSGPDWENSDALPCKFTNVGVPFLDRGTYFEAK